MKPNQISRTMKVPDLNFFFIELTKIQKYVLNIFFSKLNAILCYNFFCKTTKKKMYYKQFFSQLET